jgi:type II secretory pathway pseudopilin PulG
MRIESVQNGNVRGMRAITLVEVLASLMLIGTVGASMLVAQSRAVKHIRQADLSLVGAHMAGELIATWRLNQPQQRDADGEVPGAEGWWWSIRTEPRALTTRLTVTEAVLNLRYRNANEPGEFWEREYRWVVRDGGRPHPSLPR